MFNFVLLLLCLVTFATASKCLDRSAGSYEFQPSKCYILGSTKLNWNDAENFCKSLGGHLGYVEDYDENRFFSTYVNQVLQTYTEYWIGSNNFVHSSTWTYSDGNPLKFSYWKYGGPEITNNSKCASVISESRHWQSSNCLEKKEFVCEVERIIPSNAWIPNPDTGHQYKVFNFSTTWKIAERICNRESSHLISIHSKQEMLFATRLIKPYTLKGSNDSCKYRFQTWIGLLTFNDNKTWIWTDNSAYNNTIHKELWALSEPDNPGMQDCGNIWTENACFPWVQNKFYNHDCKLTMNNFICKKPI
uniref:C-type lectin domain-containing protein n=1 Tax=Panagrolaimus sp. ES5 TaxID=591445 RepID=A0AC34F7W6_9BILA